MAGERMRVVCDVRFSCQCTPVYPSPLDECILEVDDRLGIRYPGDRPR